MRVVLQGYNTCCQNKAGGVRERIKKIYTLLNNELENVELFNTFSTELQQGDILHVFRLDSENTGLIECAKQRGAKVVISTIINLEDGWKIDFYRRIINKFPIMTTYKLMFKSLRLADSVIVETFAEKTYIQKHYRIPASKINVIPNGIDPIAEYGEEIYELIGGKKKYVLQVGRFDNNKNQLNVIKAMKNTNIDIVFIGGPDHNNESYYKECIKLAEDCDNIHFLGWQTDKKLIASAYGNADTFVLPSFHETFGLVLLEAGVSGAKLAISNTLPILEFDSFNACNTFDPNNGEKIREAIIKTYKSEKDTVLKDKILQQFSWTNVIKLHLDLYSQL